MLQIARWRIIVVAIVTFFGVALAMPNLFSEQTRESWPGFMPKTGVNLGLDLRGGSYLLLQIDNEALLTQQLENVADSMRGALRDAEPRINFSPPGIANGVARVRIHNPEEMDRALETVRAIIDESTGQPNLEITRGDEEGYIEARVPERVLRALSRQAATQSIEIIRDRIDPTGTNEVSIVRQGDDRVVVQAPGVSDPTMLRERIGATALMTFHLVNENVDQAEIQAGLIPAGHIVVGPYPGARSSSYEVVRRRPELTGEHLTQANPTIDPNTNQYVLSFELDSEGDRIFCRLTGQYTGQRFAILLDNQVLTAPSINEPICGGRGQISGGFTAQSAQDLAIMLRAGALPAPLTVIEQRVVTAGLGEDSINAGILAGVVGAIAVVVFMVLFYGGFGIMACIALVINIVLIIASMSMIGAALTLPGIAGLILTIGMAVDANVLIYERMREEQANGRSAALAIDGGFSRAIVTIFDANITTILAALILFQFGAGPVRGFAWTLSIGCITTVFTATIVTQLMIAFWFRTVRPKQLPI